MYTATAHLCLRALGSVSFHPVWGPHCGVPSDVGQSFPSSRCLTLLGVNNSLFVQKINPMDPPCRVFWAVGRELAAEKIRKMPHVTRLHKGEHTAQREEAGADTGNMLVLAHPSPPLQHTGCERTESAAR